MAEMVQETEKHTKVKASDAEKVSFLKKYDSFVFDCDGTLWRGPQTIDGAAEVIEFLRTLKKKIFFVTNNSTKSRSAYLRKFSDLGIPATCEEVYGSAYAAAAYLESIGFKKKAYVIGEAGIVEELQAVGIEAIGGPAHRGVDADWSKGEVVEVDREIGAVVVGVDHALSYYKLQYGMTCLLENPGCTFVATNTDARGHFCEQQEGPGAGACVAALKACSEVEPTVVGKPSSFILDDILARHPDLRAERLAVVGDRLDTDIMWANAHGCGSILVMTGVTSKERLSNASTNMQPTIWLDSVADMLSARSAFNL